MYIINIISYSYSIFILSLILFSIRSSTKTVKNEKFKLTLYCALFYFLLEVVWNIIDSKNIYMGYVLNRTICILLLITESVLTYLWYDYFKSTFTRFTNLEGKKIRHINFWEKIPLILLILTSLTAFFSDYIFSIDDNNCYVAGKGFWIYSVAYYFYPLVVSGLSLYIFIKTRQKATKKQALFFIQFFIYLLIAGILLLITKINSLTGAGISLALLSFYISLKKQQISNDTLTNLSNFNSIEALLDDKISEYASNPFDLYIILLSIKNIKQISDIYGIIEGEKAITKVAEGLEHLNLQNNYHVARYNSGGFIIVCEYIDEQELKDFCNKTRSILNNLSVEDELKIQYGLGVKKYENPNISVNEFLMQADANLYLGKSI